MRCSAVSVSVALLLVVLTAAGCGGSDPAPLSTAAFVKQGNAVCVSADAQLGQAMKAAGGTSGDEEQALTAAAASSVQQMVEELSSLGVPKPDEKQVEAILAGYEKGIASMEKDLFSAVNGDAFSAANKAAEKYGLSDCVI